MLSETGQISQMCILHHAIYIKYKDRQKFIYNVGGQEREYFGMERKA